MRPKRFAMLKYNRSGWAFVAAIVLVAVFSFGCKTGSGIANSETDMKNTGIHKIKQKKRDLLNKDVEAICYSGFRSGQHPDRGDGAVNPTDEQILEDLQMVSESMGFNLIRVYDSGENSQAVLRLIRENNLDIKVMLGMWLNAELSNHEGCAWLTEPIPQEELNANKKKNRREISTGIQLAKEYPEVVVAVNVGNEALVDWNDHLVDTDTIIAYVKRVQNAISQPVTVADNYLWWAQKGKKLAETVDFVTVHVYPVWEGKDIDEGLSYSVQNMQMVRDSLPNSRLVIGEAGWASVASEFGDRASEEKQVVYYEELMAWAKEKNITTFFFEAFDEDWKGNPDNPMGAEKHWGLYTVDRKPKKIAHKLLEK